MRYAQCNPATPRSVTAGGDVMNSAHALVIAMCMASAGCAIEAQGLGPDPSSSPAVVRATTGNCEHPIDLLREGTRDGSAVIYRGTTADGANALHPYDRCVAVDSEEKVFMYRVPAGAHAVQISTEGSGFDTALFVRDHCAQAPGGMDLACNNDSYDHAPAASVYLTQLVEGSVLFIVVDGNAAESNMNGAFVLTVREVETGGAGQLCRPFVEGSAEPRCDAPLRCSEGGGADGSDLCVTTVSAGQPCDARRFNNLCDTGSTCAVDPTPRRGVTEATVCSLPGTHAGTPCRTSEPRCDGALVCGAGRDPMCVRVLDPEEICDVDGEVNRCPAGTTCRALTPDGDTTCRP